MHQKVRDNMEKGWDVKFSHACSMKNLASITLDVERLFCYLGCCRIDTLGNLLSTFAMKFCMDDWFDSYYPRLSIPGLQVTVKGIRGEEEEKYVQAAELPIWIAEREHQNPFLISG